MRGAEQAWRDDGTPRGMYVLFAVQSYLRQDKLLSKGNE
jgi:hypothetical protein